MTTGGKCYLLECDWTLEWNLKQEDGTELILNSVFEMQLYQLLKWMHSVKRSDVLMTCQSWWSRAKILLSTCLCFKIIYSCWTVLQASASLKLYTWIDRNMPEVGRKSYDRSFAFSSLILTFNAVCSMLSEEDILELLELLKFRLILAMQWSAVNNRFLRSPWSTLFTLGLWTSCSTKRWDWKHKKSSW